MKDLGFEHTVIVQPGLIFGDRGESRPIEGIFRGTAKFLGAISGAIDSVLRRVVRMCEPWHD